MEHKHQAQEHTILDRPSEALITIDAALETPVYANVKRATAHARDRSQHRRYYWLFEDLMN